MMRAQMHEWTEREQERQEIADEKRETVTTEDRDDDADGDDADEAVS